MHQIYTNLMVSFSCQNFRHFMKLLRRRHYTNFYTDPATSTQYFSSTLKKEKTTSWSLVCWAFVCLGLVWYIWYFLVELHRVSRHIFGLLGDIKVLLGSKWFSPEINISHTCNWIQVTVHPVKLLASFVFLQFLITFFINQSLPTI